MSEQHHYQHGASSLTTSVTALPTWFDRWTACYGIDHMPHVDPAFIGALTVVLQFMAREVA